MSTATKVTHTPGPWTDVSDKPGINGSAMVATPHSTACIDCTKSGLSYAEDLANARLIAAAPEMLEILEKFVGVGCDCGICLYCKADRVIHKAKGNL